MSAEVVTIDSHVTSDCNPSCPFCWGPRDFENPVDTETSLRIIERVQAFEAKHLRHSRGWRKVRHQ